MSYRGFNHVAQCSKHGLFGYMARSRIFDHLLDRSYVVSASDGEILEELDIRLDSWSHDPRSFGGFGHVVQCSRRGLFGCMVQSMTSSHLLDRSYVIFDEENLEELGNHLDSWSHDPRSYRGSDRVAQCSKHGLFGYMAQSMISGRLLDRSYVVSDEENASFCAFVEEMGSPNIRMVKESQHAIPFRWSSYVVRQSKH